MKKKYKVTTLLVFAICFFAAMILADVFLVNKDSNKKTEKKVLAAGSNEVDMANEQEEVLSTASVEADTDNGTKTEALKSVVDGTGDVSKEDALEDKVLENTDKLTNTLNENKTIDEVTNSEETKNETDEEKNKKDEKIIDEDIKEETNKEETNNEETNNIEMYADEITDEDSMETGVLSMAASRARDVVVFDKALPKVSEFLNIRSDADSEAEVVGKLYKGSYATIIERGDEWTKISSGDVTGYASNDYLYFDQDAINAAKKLEAFKVKITAGTVNVRSEAGTDSEVLTEASKDDTFIHLNEYDTNEWTAIQYSDDTIAYVASEFANEFVDLDDAVSKAEEVKIQKEKEIAKSLEEAKKFKPSKTNRAALKATDEEIFLIATVVAMEALGESYEGKLAVANVIVNRVLSGKWGDSISDVIYAPGQFSGANSGRIEKFESKVTESCKKAAIEALAGNNNIGDYMFFMMKNQAKLSSYSKYYILESHCFYQR